MSVAPPIETKRAMRSGAAAAGFYLLVSLWSLAPILPQPFDTVPMPISVRESPFRGIVAQDQKLTAATIAFNARVLLTSPQRFWDGPQCYAVHRAATLGEHMLGAGLRAAVLALFTEDPVLPYNFVLLFDRWFAALAMYALVFALTRSFPAALVGGLVFGLHPFRTEEVAHPYYVANYWTPLALLFAYRLMRSARWADAFALAGLVSLQVIEGAYPLLALAVFGGSFGLYLVIENRSRLAELFPKLLLFACVSGSVVGWILHLYGRTAAEWSIQGSGLSFLHRIQDFGPGYWTFPGFVLSGLLLVGALARPKGLDRDLRPPFLVAGAATFLWVLAPIPVPSLGLEIPSLFLLARRFIGFFELVRVPGAAASAIYISCAVLAALAVHNLTAGRPRRSRALWTVGVTTAVLVELWYPRLAEISFGFPLESVAVRVTPSPEDQKLYRKVASGPLLDLPNPERDSIAWLNTGDYVFGAAYHRQRIGGCYNSHSVAVQDDLVQIAERIPAGAEALQQLHALGFRNLIVHVDRSGEAPALLEPLSRPARLVGRTATLILYHIESEQEVVASLDLLELETTEVLSHVDLPSGRDQPLVFPFRNVGRAAFRHPDPIVPSDVIVRWVDPAGSTVAVQPLRILLPVALEPHGRWARRETIRVPERVGTYQVELAPADDPARVLSRVAARLGAPPALGADALAPDSKALE